MEQWSEIRRRVLVEGVSKRQILRETGLHWRTLEKILGHSAPPGYRQGRPRPKGKIGPFVERIGQILEDDRQMPKKQRHTARRIFGRLRAEGYQGGYTAVREAVADITNKRREVFVPLSHPPGEAQFDFGEATAIIDGVQCKAALAVMTLPYSDAFCVTAFPRECTDTFQAGHVAAFEFFGGVPTRTSYDNTTIAVSKVIGPGQRNLT